MKKQRIRREKEKEKSSWKYIQLVSGDLLKRLPLKALLLFGLNTGLQNPLRCHQIVRERFFFVINNCSETLLQLV